MPSVPQLEGQIYVSRFPSRARNELPSRRPSDTQVTVVRPKNYTIAQLDSLDPPVSSRFQFRWRLATSWMPESPSSTTSTLRLIFGQFRPKGSIYASYQVQQDRRSERSSQPRQNPDGYQLPLRPER